MKKLLVTSIIILTLLGIGAISWSADPLETKKTIDVSLEVPDVFGFQIESEEYDQTLYPHSDIDGERQGEFHIKVTTNRGDYWTVQAECPGLFRAGEETGYGVPLTISTFGTAVSPVSGKTVTDLMLDASPKSIYTSSGNERYVNDFLINSTFEVKKNVLPLAGGSYHGFMTLTMTGAIAPR